MNTRCAFLLVLLGLSITVGFPKGTRSKGTLLAKRQLDEAQPSVVVEDQATQLDVAGEKPVEENQPVEDEVVSLDEQTEIAAVDPTEAALEADSSSIEPIVNPVETEVNPSETDATATQNTPSTEVPQPVEDDEDGESDDDNDGDLFRTLFPKGRNENGASYNAFFPILFGTGNGRSAGGAGGTTAIANSFNTARKGKANSKATANGVISRQ